MNLDLVFHWLIVLRPQDGAEGVHSSPPSRTVLSYTFNFAPNHTDARRFCHHGAMPALSGNATLAFALRIPIHPSAACDRPSSNSSFSLGGIRSWRVCMFGWELIISGTTDSNWKIMFVLDSALIEEDYRLFHITLRPLGSEQRVNRGGQLVYILNASTVHVAVIFLL